MAYPLLSDQISNIVLELHLLYLYHLTNNADEGGALQPNARLNRNQAHQQEIN